MKKLKPMKAKPSVVFIMWTDPFTGEFLSGIIAPFDKVRASKSFYSKTAKNLKKIALKWCGYRKPKLTVTMR